MGVYAVNKQVIFSLLMSQACKEKPAECNDPPLEGPPEAYQGNFWSGIPRNSQIFYWDVLLVLSKWIIPWEPKTFIFTGYNPYSRASNLDFFSRFCGPMVLSKWIISPP